jgi:AcrR family transcriptional regulator
VIPNLWHDTVQTHRREVRDAILETTAALVGQHGLRSVTMSQIAEVTGIGRATLYKYFSGVEPILIAWHERHVSQHLEHLTQLRNQPGEPGGRLEAVLQGYASIAFERHQHGAQLGALVHQGERTAAPEQQLRDIIRELLADGLAVGIVRDDVPLDELAAYCLHALGAAGDLPSESAVRRLALVVLAGLEP